MAGKIKGITIELSGDTTKLEKALGNSEKNIKSVKSELREVEKALKIDPSNVELLAQKEKLLSEQVKETAEKLRILNEAQQQVKEQYDKGQITGEQYRAFEREVIATEQALNNLESELKETRTSSSKLDDVTENLNKALSKTVGVVKAVTQSMQQLANVTLKALQISLKAVVAEVEIGIKAFKAYASGLTAVSTAIGGFAIKSGASFEQSMSKVSSLSGATGEELEALEKKARELGESTSKSATDAADALGYMALAGWNEEQMLTGLEPVLRASEAGTMDLATCSDLVTDSMSAMGIQVKDLNHYLDVVTTTQNNANTSMQQMLEAYVGVGGTLKNMNVPLEESATLIGILANRGIKGSEAGTSLNSVLVNLMGASGTAAEALEELGVSMYDIDGNRKSVTATLTELNAKLAECSESEKDVFTAHIGGKTQMDTLQALMSGLTEEYGDLSESINNADGVLIKTAKDMQDNFLGAVESVKSASEGLGIAIYDGTKDGLKESMQFIAGQIKVLSHAISEGYDISGTLNLIFARVREQLWVYIAKLATELPAKLNIYNTVILQVLKTIVDAIPRVSATIIPSILTAMSDLLSKIISNLPAYITNISVGIRTLLKGVVNVMKQSASQFKDILPEVLNVIFSKSNVDAFKDVFTTGIEIITILIQGITSALPDVIPKIIDCIGTMLNTMVTAIVDNLPLIIDTGLQLLVALLNGILDNLGYVIESIQVCIDSIVQTILEHLPDILEAGWQILWALISGITEMLPELITTAVDLILILVDSICDNLDDLLKAALEIIMALCDGLLGTDALAKLLDAVMQITEAILFAVIDNLDLIIEAAIRILVQLGSSLVEMAGKLLDYMPALMKKISDALENYDWVGLGGRIMQAIFDGITAVANRAQDALASAGESILDALGFHPDGTYTLPFFADGGTLTSGSAIVGEAGPELLSVSNGRAVVTPLTNNNTNSTTSVNSPVYHINNIVNVEKISSDYDIHRINEQLASEQKRNLAAIGG